MTGYRTIFYIIFLCVCIIPSVGCVTVEFCTADEVAFNQLNSYNILRSPNYQTNAYYNISKDCEINVTVVNIAKPYVVNAVQTSLIDCTERFRVLDVCKNPFTDQTTNCTGSVGLHSRSVHTYFRSGERQTLFVRLPAGYAPRVSITLSVIPITDVTSTSTTLAATAPTTTRSTTATSICATNSPTPSTSITSATPHITTSSASSSSATLNTTHEMTSTATSPEFITNTASRGTTHHSSIQEVDTPTSPLPTGCEEKCQQREYVTAGIGVAGFIAGVLVTFVTTVVLLRTRYVISKRKDESKKPADVETTTEYDVVVESTRPRGQRKTAIIYDEAAAETAVKYDETKAHRYSYVDLPEGVSSVSVNEYMSLNTTSVNSSTEGSAMRETHLYEKIPQAKSSGK